MAGNQQAHCSQSRGKDRGKLPLVGKAGTQGGQGLASSRPTHRQTRDMPRLSAPRPRRGVPVQTDGTAWLQMAGELQPYVLGSWRGPCTCAAAAAP